MGGFKIFALDQVDIMHDFHHMMQEVVSFDTLEEAKEFIQGNKNLEILDTEEMQNISWCPLGFIRSYWYANSWNLMF